MNNIWKKKTTYLVLGLLAFLLWAIENESRAETIAEFSPLVAVRGKPVDNWMSLMIHERFKEKYSVGAIILIDSESRANSNKAIELLRVSRYKNVEAGLGYTLWSKKSAAWNDKQTFALMLGYTWKKCALRLRHWSTGGTSSLNSGLDMVTVGCQFGVK